MSTLALSAPAAAASASQAPGSADAPVPGVDRRLAAVLIADVAGYSRLMERDETGTHLRVQALRRDVIEPALARHGGRITRSTGDGLLVTFDDATAALFCALEMQHALALRNAGVTPDTQIRFRMGLNVGEVLFDRHDIAGTSVNLAARLEALARPGEICLSQALVESIPASLASCCIDAGHRRVKNLRDPVRIYRVLTGPLTPATALREWLAATLVEVRRWIALGSSAAVLGALAVSLSSSPATARQDGLQSAASPAVRAASVVPAVHAGVVTAPRRVPIS